MQARRHESAEPDGDGLAHGLAFLESGSTTGREILEHDWSHTVLGPIEAWPISLKTTLAMMLACPAPMYLAWGPELSSFYNDAYRPIFGDRLPRALGASFPEIWSDLWDTIGPMAEAALAGRSVSQSDLPLAMNRHGSPEETWWTFSYSPVCDDEGRIAGMICVTSETTSRVVAERKQAEGNARLELALSSGNRIGTWDWDIAADRVHADARFALLYGVDPELAARGAPIADFFRNIHPDDHSPLHAAIETALRTGELLSVEYRLIQPDGSERWVAAQGRCVRDAAGLPSRLPGVSFDITERREAEEALRESEDRFRAIANSVDHMIWSTRADGHHDYYNDHWYDFTGIPYGEIDDEAWSRMLHPDDRERARQAWQRSLETGAHYEIEYRLRHHTGTYRRALGRAKPLRDRDGRITRWFGSVTDIHDIRVAEDRQAFLLALNDRLRETDDPRAACLGAASALGRQLDATRAGYGEVDEAGRIVHIDQEWSSDEGPRTVEGAYIKLTSFGTPDPMLVLGLGTLIVNDWQNDPRITAQYAEFWRKLGCRALMVVPLIRDGKLRAVLFVHDSAPRRWTTDEIALAEDTAQRTWDAVERARAEQALRANVREMRLIADAMPVLIGFVDAHLNYRFANAAYLEWFGLTPDQMIGRKVSELFDAEQFELRRPYVERALSGEETRFEVNWPGSGGELRTADTRYLPRRQENGRVDGFYVFVQDITDRKRIEAVLTEEVGKRTRERDRLWQTTNDLMSIAGLDGFLKSINPAWSRLLGWSDEQILGKPFLSLVDPLDQAETRAAMKRIEAGEAVTGAVTRVVQRDGGRRTVMWTAIPEDDGLFVVGRDITEQREAEARLWQAQKMEAVGQLTGGIAHDFNNLLTGIVGSLDLMQTRIGQGRTDALQRYADAAMNSANRAAALTHRLLAFARRQPLEQRAVDTNALIRGMEDMLRRTIREEIALEIVTTDGLWPTLCDPHQLENAILNLAINARDAMPEGGRLTIETSNTHLDEAVADAGTGFFVCVRVADTGIGMSEEVAARVFEPFFTTKPIGVGTGLGLSMIYGFVHQSDGHVAIESAPNQGTSVKLYLPRYRGDVDDANSSEEPGEAPRAERGETVLVVEDEPVVRDLVVEVLRDLGYRALEAPDGPGGLTILQSRKRIDLLVTDVGLPGLNGRQLAALGRELRPKLKVLFMTGYAENATFGGGLDNMQMITKPFAVDALATRIREMIEA